MELSTESWRAFTDAEREKAARQLARDLPSGFQFQAIRTCRMGDRQNAVAFYTSGSATFALIPGGPVTLGFDANRPWEPTPAEADDWQATAAEYEFKETIMEYVARVTLRPRTVVLAPCLIETAYRELGWQEIMGFDPEVRAILEEYGGKTPVEVVRGGTSTRVMPNADGTVTAERSLPLIHDALAAQLREDGYRFPTSDEWEYACGSGAPTLFRWGDHAPDNGYPTNRDLRGPEDSETPLTFWNQHRERNAFGLSIASNPYHQELVDDTGTTRGGDGGVVVCGGAGFFLGWLTLATAYFDETFCKHDPSETITVGYTFGRRVLSLV